jgi:hypothetical protein
VGVPSGEAEDASRSAGPANGPSAEWRRARSRRQRAIVEHQFAATIAAETVISVSFHIRI